MFRFLIILISFFFFSALSGQDVTIINNYNGDSKLSEENFVLKSVTEHTYIINEYEPSNTGERSHLEQMISYGLRSYVDNQLHVFDGGIEVLQNPADFQMASKAVVTNAIWIHDLSFHNEFDGFSDEIYTQVQALAALDGYRISTGDADLNEPKNGTVGLYTFQKMVYKLKVSLEIEVEAFLDIWLPQTNQRNFEENESQILSNQDYQLNSMSNNEVELLNIEPDMDFLEPKEKKKKDKDEPAVVDTDLFSERIVALLESNNKLLASHDQRFDNMQNQIDALKDNQNQALENSLKDEIAELRNMILELSKGNTIVEPDGSTTSMTADKVTLIFDKNIHDLNLAHQAQLNVAVQKLRDNKSLTALITGYADKTGNAALNAWISKERALSVKEYFEKNGIQDNRLVINFLGDAESEFANPADRKVEVQFLQNTLSEQ